MIRSDRDRLVVGVGVAFALHVLLFGILAAAGMDFTPYPENEPVFVTLPDYDEPASPETQEPDVPPAEPEPAESEPITTQPEAVQPERSAEPAQPRSDAAAATDQAPRPAPQIRSEPAAPTGRDAPEGSFSTEDLPWLNDAASDTTRERESAEDLFAIDEPDSTSELPSWVVEGEFSLQPESSLDEEEQESLESKRDAVPGFTERLNELVRAIANPSQAPQPGGDAGTDDGSEAARPGSDPTAIPGGGSIEWVGSGTRRPVGQLVLPRLTASDFGGQVPARISFLVVFEVNEDGLVVPGSLILRQSSGYTLADQKVRRAVSSWRFDPAPGTRPVTAIATLHIARDQIR